MWIEISGEMKGGFAGKVTSLAEVWIEIADDASSARSPYMVTSLAEVWIEIPYLSALWIRHKVTSLAEVWIEMSKDS